MAHNYENLKQELHPKGSALLDFFISQSKKRETLTFEDSNEFFAKSLHCCHSTIKKALSYLKENDLISVDITRKRIDKETIHTFRKITIHLKKILEFVDQFKKTKCVYFYKKIKELAQSFSSFSDGRNSADNCIYISPKGDTFKDETIFKKNQDQQPGTDPIDQFINLIEDEINPNLEKPLEINKKILPYVIKKAIRSHFGTFDNLLNFIHIVAANPFLLGKKAFKNDKKFKLSIGSLFSWKIYQYFREGVKYFNIWDDKPKEEDKNIMCYQREEDQKDEFSIPSHDEMLIDIKNKNYPEKEIELRHKILSQLGIVVYKSWFSEILIEFDCSKCKIKVNSEFQKDTLINRFGSSLRKICGCPVEIDLKDSILI